MLVVVVLLGCCCIGGLVVDLVLGSGCLGLRCFWLLLFGRLAYLLVG